MADEALHLTVRLANSMRAAIRRGEYAAGRPVPSERVLCARTGYSRTTVRRAIQLLVDEGSLYRVPRSGTFVGRASEGGMRRGALGLVVPALANPIMGELANTIEREASGRGYYLLVGQSHYQDADEAACLPRYAESPTVRGVLVVTSGATATAEAFMELRRRRLPFILAMRGGEGGESDAVVTDHVRGAREIVRYLLGLGHRRIAFVGAARPMPDRHRQGYCQALREVGLSEDPDLVRIPNVEAEEAGAAGVRAMLERRVPFSAVFARIDLTAVGVLRALRAAGLRVPEDVSVAGFDNTQLSAHLQPPLTTVDQTLPEIGRQAVSFLLDRVEGRYDGPARQVIIQPRLVLRDSCAPAAGPAGDRTDDALRAVEMP